VLSRVDESLSRDTPMKNFREVFTSHFYVTTSGFFSDPALRCCVEEMGVDRVMFSVDWPFVSNKEGVDWLRNNYLGPADREKIFSGTARKLLRL
jgi:predicted TIM-barrel fold metal-dependent hydrolase